MMVICMRDVFVHFVQCSSQFLSRVLFAIPRQEVNRNIFMPRHDLCLVCGESPGVVVMDATVREIDQCKLPDSFEGWVLTPLHSIPHASTTYLIIVVHDRMTCHGGCDDLNAANSAIRAASLSARKLQVCESLSHRLHRYLSLRLSSVVSFYFLRPPFPDERIQNVAP
jgi:hypothetical protein